MIAFQVRNYRAIERADVACNPIALVGAINGAGKSSLYEAAQAALTKVAITLDGVLKKDAAKIVHRGAETGHVRVSQENHTKGSTTIKWPSCAITYDGVSPIATPFAAGTAHLLDLDARDRVQALSKYVEAIPSDEALGKALFDIGYGVRGQRIVIDECAKDWDATWETAKLNGTKLKGKWEATTGDKWGKEKAADWKPKDWGDALDVMDADTAAQIVAERQQNVEKHIGSVAVSAAELDSLRAKAATPMPDVGKLQADSARIATEIMTAKEELAKLPATVSAEPHEMACPACGVMLVSDTDADRKAVLKEAKKVDAKGLKDARLERAGIEGRITRLNAEATAAQRRLTDAKNAAADIQAAKDRLDRVEHADTKADADALDIARGALADAQKALSMVKARAEAKAIYQQWQKNESLTALLAPDGIRKATLVKALGEFNAKLAELSGWAKWATVSLTEDLGGRFGHEPTLLCSKSQRFRLRATIQVAMALIDKSAAVLIDDADILDNAGRNGLLTMLKKAGIPALVCCTTNSPDKLANLDAAGFGHSYFITEGVCCHIGATQQAAQ